MAPPGGMIAQADNITGTRTWSTSTALIGALRPKTERSGAAIPTTLPTVYAVRSFPMPDSGG